MRSVAVKLLSVITSVLILVPAVSCSKTNPPAYLLEGAEDNGWVPAYRAYFSIDGDKVRKITTHRYESLIYDDNIDYKMISQTLYSLDAYAVTEDPSGWEFEAYRSYFDDIDTLDEETLIGYLQMMGISYTGEVYIVVMEFDDYLSLEVNLLDNSTVEGRKSGLFRDGKKIDLPNNVTFRSIRSVYRLE